MRIKTKRIRVIEMTTEEIEKFHRLMDEARQGQTVNYAEERLEDGSFLGVSVVENSTIPDTKRRTAKSHRNNDDGY